MKNSSYFESFRKDADNFLTSMQSATKYPAHFHRVIEITYIMKGSCTSTINNVTVNASEHEILFASSYYSHSYSTTKNAKRLLFFPSLNINFDEKVLPNDLTFPSVLSDKDFNKSRILPILKKIYSVERSDSFDNPARLLMLNGLTATFWAELYERYRDRLVTREVYLKQFASVLLYIDNNYKENITLDTLSDVFGYSKQYFSKMFNLHFHTNLNNYINNIRVKAFISLYLKNQEANITHLALDVGFNSKSTFYREFARIYNCKPKEYFTKTDFY